LWPRVPEEVRDAYAQMQYERLAQQVTGLYAALVVIVMAAMAGATTTASPLVRFGIPVLVACACLARMIIWVRRPPRLADATEARNYVRRARLMSAAIAAISSVWCIAAWRHAPVEISAYFPLFMAMGSFATVSCLSMSRSGTLLNLVAGLVPIALALILSGDAMAMAAGASMITAACFILQLSHRQHEKAVELLLLQRQMHILSRTDPLTELPNRRALQEQLEAQIAEAQAGRGPTLILIDLDGFKPVNDRHGHGAGDAVLREVAARFSTAVCGGTVCRLGGDEFAVLVPADAPVSARATSDALLASLVRPFSVGKQAIRVGASLGMAVWPDDGTTIEALFHAADRALYSAKADHGDEFARAPQPMRASRR